MATIIKLLLFFLLISEFSNLSTSKNISLGSSLSLPGTTNNNSYWLSDSGQFAFGFYRQTNGNFSVSIWFHNIKQKTVVWSANTPLLGGQATLVLNLNGKLVLRDDGGSETLISQNSQSAEFASMLDSGNFALYGPNSAVLWRSFDSPTDTLLPSQPLLAGKRLVSAGGRFQLVMQSDGNLVQYPLSPGIQLTPYHGYWNTETYTLGANVSLNLEGDGQLYLLNSADFNVKSINSVGDQSRTGSYRLSLHSDGILRLYRHSLTDPNSDWAVKWASTSNKCDPIGLCGLNSYCSLIGQEARCLCLPSFDFVDTNHKSLGCERNSSLVACKGRNEISFENLNGIQWENNSYSTMMLSSEADCEEECRRDCDCEFAIFANQLCNKLKFRLRFAKVNNGVDSSTTMVKVLTAKRRVSKSTKMIILNATISSLGIISLAVTVALVFRFRMWEYKKIKNESTEEEEEFIEDLTLRAYEYSELEKATDGFADRIGRGGFGTVFKGSIRRKAVAVKRLERSTADDREFRNEMRAIGKTHHRNLVRLLGYCHRGAHRLLVYEYIEKGSLSDYLFESETKPDWEERLGIALSIARGILYLHEECETRIIHCDIKPENILMGERNNPKIADFGLAKLLMPNQTRTDTGLRGTRGYVAPEWHRNMPITVKADVYSFGIVLLEIVCCRRSVDMDVPEDKVVLSNWVFECFVNNELDKLVEEEVDEIELEKMIKLGLWCIQEEASLRPSMKRVCLMLEGTVEIPRPPHPMSSG